MTVTKYGITLSAFYVEVIIICICSVVERAAVNIFHDRICYTEKLEVTRILQLYQRNGKPPLPWWKQGNYPVITIYANRSINMFYYFSYLFFTSVLGIYSFKYLLILLSLESVFNDELHLAPFNFQLIRPWKVRTMISYS